MDKFINSLNQQDFSTNQKCFRLLLFIYSTLILMSLDGMVSLYRDKPMLQDRRLVDGTTCHF